MFHRENRLPSKIQFLLEIDNIIYHVLEKHNKFGDTMKTRNLYRIIIGMLLTLAGALTIVLTQGDSIAGSILLIAGIVFLITGIIRHRRYGDDPESDERSKRIGAYGLSYSWFTGLLFMTVLYWLDYSGIVRLETQAALALSIIVLAFSAVIYQTYLFRKGDVDEDGIRRDDQCRPE